MFTFTIATCALMLAQPATAGAEPPLALELYAAGAQPGAPFLHGAPLQLTVYVYNAQIRRSAAAARERWVAAVDQALLDGVAPPEPPGRYQPAEDDLVRVGGAASDWFADVRISIERIGLRAGPVLADTDWSALRQKNGAASAGVIELAHEPVWSTLLLTPDQAAQLGPGDYRIRVEYPRAEPLTRLIHIRAPQDDAEQAQLSLELAEYAISKGRFAQAIDLARAALGRLPQQQEGIVDLVLGRAYAGAQEWERAVDAYERFLAIHEGTQRWHFPQQIRNLVEQIRQEHLGQAKP